MIKFNSTYFKLFINKSYLLPIAFNKFSFKNFYFQESGRHGAGDHQMVAKRVINSVGRILRESDPHRWDGVPITFETKWNNEDTPWLDVRTAVLINDALEKEFNIDIEDRKKLFRNVKDCVNFILECHTAI